VLLMKDHPRLHLWFLSWEMAKFEVVLSVYSYLCNLEMNKISLVSG